ncbi:hypothetical protein B0H10DRAFT_1967072 [Mycena sp. CBHHK59/15]|nr:hypothetical protein B0H10DRAFT_1967072 [Mycena sp. CBHHK59/15]
MLLLAATVFALLWRSSGTPLAERPTQPSYISKQLTADNLLCDLLVDSCTANITHSNVNSTWIIPSCVAGATCNGPAKVMDSICNQTQICPHSKNQANLSTAVGLYHQFLSCNTIPGWSDQNQELNHQFHGCKIHQFYHILCLTDSTDM